MSLFGLGAALGVYAPPRCPHCGIGFQGQYDHMREQVLMQQSLMQQMLARPLVAPPKPPDEKYKQRCEEWVSRFRRACDA